MRGGVTMQHLTLGELLWVLQSTLGGEGGIRTAIQIGEIAEQMRGYVSFDKAGLWVVHVGQGDIHYPVHLCL